MRILVTGASGLLGLNLALEASQNHTVFGQVYSHPIHTQAFQVIQADLQAPNQIERLLDETQPDWVIHCAALAVLDACEANPAQARQLNSEIPAKLAKHVARSGARLLHVSTDAVFDGQRGNYIETDTPNPLGMYARTKLEGEQAVAEANPDATIARVNFYGWSLSGKRSLSEFFFYNLLAGARLKGFTDVTFCPLLANNLAQILLDMLAAGLNGLYHVVSRQSISKYDFGVAIARRFGLDAGLITPISVTEAGLKVARSPRMTLCVDKLTQALGRPLPDISYGLENLYSLYQQQYPQQLKQMDGI